MLVFCCSALIARKRGLSQTLTLTNVCCRIGTQTGIIANPHSDERLLSYRHAYGDYRKPSLWRKPVVSARIRGLSQTLTLTNVCCRIGTHTGIIANPHSDERLLLSSHANGDYRKPSLWARRHARRRAPCMYALLSVCYLCASVSQNAGHTPIAHDSHEDATFRAQIWQDNAPLPSRAGGNYAHCLSSSGKVISAHPYLGIFPFGAVMRQPPVGVELRHRRGLHIARCTVLTMVRCNSSYTL